MTPSNVPSWFIVDSTTSQLGPVDVTPGNAAYLQLNYVLGPDYTANATMNMSLVITSSNAASAGFFPISRTWTITSTTGLKTYLMTCTNNSGTSCGSRIAPDTTPSITRIDVHPPNFMDALGRTYISTTTRIILAPYDPVLPNAMTSGLAFVGIATDTVVTATGALNSYDYTSFTFPEGVHTITVASEDNGGLWEALHSSTVYVDGTPPVTQMQFLDGSLVALNATDPVSNGVASGVAQTKVSIDGGAFALYQGMFSVAKGTHAVTYFSTDSVGNAEVVRSTIVTARIPSLSSLSPWPTARHDSAHTGLAGGIGPSLPVAQWSFASGGLSLFGEPSLGPDGTIFINERQNSSTFNLLAINPNGTLKWRAFNDGGTSGVVVRGDGIIYQGGARLWAFRPDGTVIWNDDSGVPDTLEISNPVISTDGFIWASSFGGNYGANLLKVDPNSGAVLLQLPISPVDGPSLGTDGTVYVAGTNGSLYAVNSDGSTKWSSPLTSSSFIRGVAVHPNGRICVPDSTFVQCFNPDGSQAWSFNSGRTGTRYGNAMAIGPDGTVYVFDDQNVYALAAADGNLKWKFSGYTFSNQSDKAEGVVDAAGTFYIPAMSGSQSLLLAISKSGSLLWSQAIAGGVGYNTPIIDAQGNLYLGDTLANMTKYASPNPAYLAATTTPWPASRHDFARKALASVAGPVLPTALWTYNPGSFSVFGESSIGPDGTIYIAERQNATTFNLMAVNPNGSFRWRAFTDGGHDSSAVRADGTVYVGGTRLWAIRPGGTALWNIDSGKGIANNSFSTPVIAPDGSVWAEAIYTGNLIKVSPTNGAILQQVGVNSNFAPAMGPDGTMYVGGVNGSLYAVGQDGGVKWTFVTAGASFGTATRAPLIHPNGTILVANSRFVQGVNPDGSLAWTFDNGIPGDQFSFALSVGPDGTVYANDNLNVFALNPSNGVLKWKYSDGVNQFNPSGGIHEATIVDVTGTIYVPAYARSLGQNRLVAINNGSLLWTFPTGALDGSRPIMDGSGNIFISDDGGTLYKITSEYLTSSTNSIRGLPEFQVASTVSGLTATTTSTNTTTVSLALASASAQRLTLVSDVFDLLPSQAFSPAATLTFRFNPNVVPDTTTLSIYRFDGVSWSSAGFISNQVVALGSDPRVTASLAHSSYYGLFTVSNVSSVTVDGLPPRTVLALNAPQWTAGGTLYVTGHTSFTLTSLDDALSTGDALGLGTNQQFLLVDGVTHSTFTNASPGVGRLFVSTFTLSDVDGLHYLSYGGVDVVGNREAVHTATIAVDNTPPVSTTKIGSPSYFAAGAIYVATTTPVTLSALDPPVLAVGTMTVVPGSGVSRIDVAIDTSVFSSYASTLTFAEGSHVVVFRAVDNLGNVENTHTVRILADATPPISSVAIGQPQAILSSATILVSARTPIMLSSTDPVVAGVAAGVKSVFYQINGGPFAAYTSTITLSAPDAFYTLGFYGQDNLLNAEVEKSTTVLLDSTPPLAAILSPGGPGVESIVSGAFPIIGSVSDLHLASWRLEAAPGAYAAAGFTLISSGTAAVSSSPLGTWNTVGLSGWQTLRLTAVDLVLNTTVIAENIFVGDPVVRLVFGGGGTLNKPFDAFEDAAGKVYVADANDDRIAVFTSTAGLLASYGSRRGGDDDDRRASGSPRFNKPKGVAVDAASNVYIVDTNGNRVMKLSPSGSVLLTIPSQARGGSDDEDDRQARRGQLNHPHGVALDAAGNIYVADTDNHRIQKFAADGTFLLAVNLPAAPAWHGDDDEREDDSALGRPVGIALDSTGSIYAADVSGNRVLKFDPTGVLTQTFGAGVLNHPLGVAVSTSGDVIIVSDSGDNRLLKLDRLGFVNQIYAPAGSLYQSDDDHGDDARVARSRAALNVPAELYLDAGGTVFVADRNNNRVLELSGPNAPPPPPPPAPPSAPTASVSVSTADALPPRTTLTAAAPSWSAAGILYATRQTTFTLASIDDAVSTGDAVGVGTGAQYLFIDGVARSTFTNAYPAPGQSFASTFTLPDAEGLRFVAYDAVDAAGNREVVHITTVAFDNTAPISSMTVGAPSYMVQGVVFAATSTPVALSAADPFVGVGAASAPGSGVSRIDVAIDTTSFTLYSSTLTFAPGLHTVLFRGVDNLGNMEPTHTVRVLVSSGVLVSTSCATTHITKRDGGKVERWDRAAVVLSSGTLAADLDITVSTPIPRSDLEETVKTRKRVEAGLVAISTGVEYLPEGTTFSAPVTLVLPYDPGPLASLGIQETDLRAYYWNRKTERWDLMPGSVDLVNHVVNAQTLHFSLYQVMGLGQSGGAPPADAAAQPFAFGQVYAYPNPARPGQSPTIHVEAGSADHIEVRIYDLSGQLKESASSDVINGTFEYRWEVSSVGSGVYLYVVTASKAGSGKIRRTGRLGLIK